MTKIFASGKYVELPQIRTDFQPAIRETRIIRTAKELIIITPNFRPHPDASATQSETPLVKNKQLPNILFGSANTVWPPNGFSGVGEGVYVSTNGGYLWYGFDTLIGGTPLNNHGGDPGPAIDNVGTFLMSHLGYTSSGVFVNYSTNYGVTWSPSVTLVSGSTDKNLSGSDDAAASPFLGRSYVVWSNFALGQPPIVISYTTNHGVSWSSPLPINNPPSGHYSQGCDIAVGPEGEVYVNWAAPILGSPYTEDFDGFAVSTNGGVSFTVTENAFDANGIRGYLANKSSIRVNSFPRITVDKTGGPRNGWIYIVGCDINLSPAGSTPDIILHRSTNGGTTWSSAIRVNQDAINIHFHWFPAVCIDDSGAVCVCYYDDRNVGGNLAQIYLSRSTDGGNTWTDVQVSDHNFTPTPIPGLTSGYQGDYIGIAPTNGKIFPFWCDPSSGFYQAWTVAVTIGPPLAHDIATGPFLSLPSIYIINTSYQIKTRVQNIGSSNETAIPIKFYINGILTNTSSINLLSGQIDSVNNVWTPVSPGAYILKYISSLSTDTNHLNDTVQVSITVFGSVGPLCEGFTNSTFPPAGWSIVYTGTNYWSRCTCSALNLGSGSTKYDCWTAPLGTNQDLITVSFSPAYYFDSLKFYYAYCPLGTTDSLIILASTNSGNTYTTVYRMGGTGMGTVSACTRPFTPQYASDWMKKTVGVPSGTNRLDFLGKSGFGDSFYLDSICMPMDDVIVSTNTESATEFNLAQNYPNPFNPTTKIEFSLPISGTVKLVVYNILGEEITTIANEHMHAGKYSLIFNAEKYASGIYFYKLTEGDFIDVKKMLLVK